MIPAIMESKPADRHSSVFEKSAAEDDIAPDTRLRYERLAIGERPLRWLERATVAHASRRSNERGQVGAKNETGSRCITWPAAAHAEMMGLILGPRDLRIPLAFSHSRFSAAYLFSPSTFSTIKLEERSLHKSH